MTIDNSRRVFFAVSASNTWYGKIIRKLTRSRFNHAFLVFHDMALQCKMVVQVDSDGVRLLPLDLIVDGMYSEIELFEYNGHDVSPYLPCLSTYVGTGYDWKGVWGYLIKLAHWRMFRRHIQNPVENKGELFCSEMVAFFARSAGIPWFNSLDPASVDPKMLYRIMCRDASKFKSVMLSELLANRDCG